MTTLVRAFLQAVQAFRVTESGTFLLLLVWSWLVNWDLAWGSELLDEEDEG